MGIGNLGNPFSKGTAETSLPLMGIGNLRPACGMSRSSTHYPSWGLATSAGRSSSNSALNSLPLMGIGNLKDAADLEGSHWNSLPLMGIGNEVGSE